MKLFISFIFLCIITLVIEMNYEILVNKDNPIDINYYDNVVKPSLVEIDYFRENDDVFDEIGISSKKIYLEENAGKYFLLLRTFLKKKGIIFDIVSGFLSLEEQQKKYDSYLKRNGIEKTKMKMCLPLYSEHNTGLAVDCDFYKNGTWGEICNEENESEINYIHSIIHNFGFVLRYPKDKERITNMEYEPWHIRFVGKKLAKELYDNNLTLEEYYEKKMRNNMRNK